jgi:hypothetical protein
VMVAGLPTYSRVKELAQEVWISTAVGCGGCEKLLCGLFRQRSVACIEAQLEMGRESRHPPATSIAD